MNKETKKILDDLYELDSGLRKNEKELVKIIEKLIESKPDIKIDSEFMTNLRRQLMARADELSEASPALQFNLFTMIKRWIAHFMGGAVVAALVLVTVFYYYPKGAVVSTQVSEDKTETTKTLDGTSDVSEGGVTKLSDNAFGSLSGLTGEGGQANETVSVYGRGGGAQAVSAPTATTATAESSVSGSEGVAVSSDMAVSSKAMIAPEYQYYKYVYKGETLDLTEDKVTVYRRKSMKADDSSITGAMRSFGFGVIDLSGFSDATAVNLSLSQEKKYGYEISIDFVSQSVNLYQNWGQWDSPYDKCKGEQKCYDDLRLKPKDVLSNSELQKIADSFLKENGVDLTLYGAPQTQRYWEDTSYASESEIYIPESVQLIYPLLVDGKTVMDEYANPNGLYVSVSLRDKRVSAVSNLRPDSFESSDYEAETDINELIGYANSGLWNYSEEGEAVEVELGDPEEVMVVLWRTSAETDKRQVEYFAPALKFPVVKKPDENFYTKYVVVPLAKDLLKRDTPYPILYRTMTEPAAAPAADE